MGFHPRRIPTVLTAGGIIAVLLTFSALASAQNKPGGFGEREIDPQAHAFDKPENWTLTFRFKDPRIISVDVPGRGKKIVWYMWYQVINNTGEPRYFVPDIELKTHDSETLHPDEIMPAVQEAISKIEDPTGRQNIKNSVIISESPIPLSKKDAYPRAITGVAIWTDVYDRAPKTNRFSVFVAGLSDGFRQDPKPKDGALPPVRRKTLQINFQRLGDDIQNDANAIRWVDNPSWIYRATDTDEPLKPKKDGAIIEPIKEDLPKEKIIRPLLSPISKEAFSPIARPEKSP